jgi:hypothetical protein
MACYARNSEINEFTAVAVPFRFTVYIPFVSLGARFFVYFAEAEEIGNE